MARTKQTKRGRKKQPNPEDNQHTAAPAGDSTSEGRLAMVEEDIAEDVEDVDKKGGDEEDVKPGDQRPSLGMPMKAKELSRNARKKLRRAAAKKLALANGLLPAAQTAPEPASKA